VFLRACDRPDDERQCGNEPAAQASRNDSADLMCGHFDSLSWRPGLR
jgi:hypothetical protein